jgi:hypothetical protein
MQPEAPGPARQILVRRLELRIDSSRPMRIAGAPLRPPRKYLQPVGETFFGGSIKMYQSTAYCGGRNVLCVASDFPWHRGFGRLVWPVCRPFHDQ